MAKKKQTTRKGTKKTTTKKRTKNPTEELPAEESRTEPADTAQPDQPSRVGFPIAGIGASAGGLQAMTEFFDATPDEPGLAFVIIQHLDPTKESSTAELLAQHTTMPTRQVSQSVQVQPNHVYVIPPNKDLILADGILKLSEPQGPRHVRMPIDFFFRSLAADQRQRSVGVILSGTGTDGTLGVKAIKAAGGLVLAQDPDSAEHGGMAQSAIRSGAVDQILAPQQMPDILIRHAQHPYVRELAEDETQSTAPPEQAAEQSEEAFEDRPEQLREILNLVRAHAKHDFRNYKTKTLQRRTRRRMCLRHFEQHEDYLEYLRENPKEIDALVKDLLISVTDFFRDPEAWQELEQQAIVPLVREKNSDDPLRVWVPGCATGEEAYSIAMLCFEQLQAAHKACPLQVFASDIDTDALEQARTGRYPESIASDVSPQRLPRFFVKTNGDHFRVKKFLRESVVFAEQNLISDPPFSKLDLICCRNLLIYLQAELQEQLLQLFHFALRERGCLFLGSSETIGRHSDLFETLSKRWRIYRRIGPTHHERVEIPIRTTAPRRTVAPVAESNRTHHELRVEQLVHRRLVDWLGPSAVLIDTHWKVLYICGNVDNYLTHQSGIPSDDLLKNARRGLRSKLRGAVHKAQDEKRIVQVEASLLRGSGKQPVRLVVQPFYDREQERDLLLILFEDLPAESHEATTAKASRAEMTDLDEDSVIRQLEDELATTKEELQSTIEQLETSNEELKASNEEVMSMNEELQSTNEELETSKEELQSLNEELSTVNNELSTKVEELEEKQDDLENLLVATDVATICLDRELRVRWFTPATKKVIRLTSTDIGRPISDFAHDFQENDLVGTSQEVLSTLVPDEAEISGNDGRSFIRRITPYRTEEDRIAGLVITFIDISNRKAQEQILQSSKELSEKLVDSVREAMIVLDSNLQVISANQPFYELFQVSPQAVEGKLIYQLGDGHWDIPELRQLLEKVLPEQTTFDDFQVRHHFETLGERIMMLNARQIDHLQRVLLSIRDVTDTFFAEQRRAFLLEFSDAMLAAQTPTRVLEEAATRLCRFLNCDRAAYGELDPSEDEVQLLAQHVEHGQALPEFRRLSEFGPPTLATLEENQSLIIPDIREDDRSAPYAQAYEGYDIRAAICVPRLHEDQTIGFLGVSRREPYQWSDFEADVVREIAERTALALQASRAQQALQESEELLRQAAQAAQFGSYSYDLETDQAHWSEELYAITGLDPSESMSQPRIADLIRPDYREAFRKYVAEAFSSSEGTEYAGEFPLVRPDGSERWIADQGRLLFSGHGQDRRPVRAAGMVVDITERKQIEEELRQLNESLEEQVAQRTAMLKMLQDVTRASNEAHTVEEALRAALDRIAQYNGWQVGHAWILEEDDSGQMVSSRIWQVNPEIEDQIDYLREFQQTCESMRFSPGQGIVGQVMASGQPKWVDNIDDFAQWQRGNAEALGLNAAIAFPITLNGKIIAVIEFFSDKPTRREERFLEIMPDVGIQLGHVFERKELERQTAEAAEREQRRLGSDIHDGVGQEMTGMRHLLQAHIDSLRKNSPPDAEAAQRINEGLKTVQKQLRAVIRDLVPVELDEKGFVSALQSLAERHRSIHDIECRFVCDQPIRLEDNLLATHVYRIVQEAVNNAIRHADASTITIYLQEDRTRLHLQVIDDGKGIDPDAQPQGGLGLRSMSFRADFVGAKLRIQPGESGGTVVHLTIPKRKTF